MVANRVNRARPFARGDMLVPARESRRPEFFNRPIIGLHVFSSITRAARWKRGGMASMLLLREMLNGFARRADRHLEIMASAACGWRKVAALKAAFKYLAAKS